MATACPTGFDFGHLRRQVRAMLDPMMAPA